MKKIFNHSLLTILSIVIVTLVYSQELAVNSKKETTVLSETKNHTAEVPYINNVNGKVLKSFNKSFGEKPGALWSKSENGFVVYFKENNKSTNVYFRNNGAIDYKVNYYTEEQLPNNVRQVVKSTFYDYDIKHVSEVHKESDVFYFVKVEDKKTIKTIRVVDLEWMVVEEITKQDASTTAAKSSF